MPEATARHTQDRLRTVLGWVILWASGLALTALIYSRVTSYPFLLDDRFHFVDNLSVRFLSGLGTIWTSNYWESYGQGGLYRPLLKTLWMIESVVLGGSRAAILAVGAAGHALNATLVAQIARRAGAPLPIAVAAAGWFLLHAAHSEVLITAVGQGEIASVALGLGAFALVFPGGPTGRGRLVAFTACAVASALMKEQGFVAAALGAAALWWNPGFARREKVVALCTLALGLALVTIARYAVLGGFGPSGGFTVPLGSGLAARSLATFWLAGRYVALAVAPIDLSAHYGWLHAELPTGPADPFVWLGLVAVAVSVGVGVRAERRGQLVTLAVLAAAWLPLAPFLGIVPIGDLFAERHAYHALTGAALLLAGGAAATARALPQRHGVIAATVVLGIWAGALGARAWVRVPAWESNERLWTTTLDEHPRSSFAATSLAKTYASSGRFALARQAAERALEVDPNFCAAHLVLGEIEMNARRPEAAVPHFETASLSPVQRFQAQVGLARAYLELGDLARARDIHDALAAERPDDPTLRQLGYEISRQPSHTRDRRK